MCKEKIITGVQVSRQLSKAKTILQNQVIPKEELYQIRKREGKLSTSIRKVS
ncbi:hypothetical protein [Luteibaculum oceani]|uniref:hypothetical protein n=1 Tax=Luteibaculum oceani TaxID=1294296 RepID=UPI001476FDDC|nr:hypothetical protein [Luteibaculum oceani]